ncbi:MAG: threonylcarbamoyl-AMP synthase [Verrucomicrobia bacterium]|nr:threonylcarbamoyl-AMP synthase [Verrucomicrobiota bacterium]
MTTRLLPAQDDASVAEAVRLLRAGEAVALPTETVYGLAANALDPVAVAKIFEAKERPFFDPLICHLPSRDWVARLTLPLSEKAARVVDALAERHWPGPLTLLLPRRADGVPDLVTSGLPEVAVRMSAHPVFRRVVEGFGAPLAAPSANRFGRISPTSGVHALAELDGRIPLVLEAGPTTHGVESSVVRVTAAGALEVLRPGPVTLEELRAFGPVEVIAPVASTAPASPGQLASHYAPRTPLRLLAELPLSAPRTAALLGFGPAAGPAASTAHGPVAWLSRAGDLREAAANLFHALRELDASGADVICATRVPDEGLGRAINDRLERASAK